MVTQNQFELFDNSEQLPRVLTGAGFFVNYHCTLPIGTYKQSPPGVCLLTMPTARPACDCASAVSSTPTTRARITVTVVLISLPPLFVCIVAITSSSMSGCLFALPLHPSHKTLMRAHPADVVPCRVQRPNHCHL